MSDLFLSADVSQLVQSKREIASWAKQTRDAIDIVNSRMKVLGETSPVVLNRLGNSAQVAGRKMNRMGVGMQQLGYQVGDFVVQVQSGTNAFVAFGQQATQLVSMLPMMTNSFMGLSGTALVAVSAGLGVAIPLFTAVAAAIMRTRESSDEASTGFKGLEESIEAAKEQAMGMRQELALLVSGLRNVEQLNLSQAIVVAQREVLEIEAEMENLSGRNLRAAELRLQNAQANLEAAKEALAQNEREAQVLEQIRAEQERQNELIREREEAVARIIESYDEELATQQRLLDLAQVAATYGEDSAEYAQLVAEQEREAYQLRLMSNGILGDNLKHIMAYYDQVVAINEILARPVQGPVLPSSDSETNRTVRNTRKIIRANDEVSDSIKRVNDISQMMGDSFGDAFTSVIDGTQSVGDAFKSMARSIIAELYQIFVVKQITGFITGALQNAFTGGLAPASSPVPTPRPSFAASGGTINPNSPYIVGERGPELIMPSRQSTVMNADLTAKALGGGETIVVNQTINVSTGVQQTVRNEIRSMMPQISEAAKSAVVDAKRRGGSYGRAFS